MRNNMTTSNSILDMVPKENASIQTMILLTMKVIHVSGMNGNTIIVVTMMTTILTRTKCAVVVVEDTIPQLIAVQAATDRRALKITQIASLARHVCLDSCI